MYVCGKAHRREELKGGVFITRRINPACDALAEHFVQVGCDAEQQDKEDHLHDDIGGAAGFLKSLLEFKVHVIEVARGLVHVVANLVDHHALQFDLI